MGSERRLLEYALDWGPEVVSEPSRTWGECMPPCRGQKVQCNSDSQRGGFHIQLSRLFTEQGDPSEGAGQAATQPCTLGTRRRFLTPTEPTWELG